jgi:hypothetical protein
MRTLRRARLSWAATAWLTALAPARAEEALAPASQPDEQTAKAESSRPPLDSTPPLGILPTSEDALIDPRMAASWGALPPRIFLATTTDVGFVYFRPRVSLGYGKPFTLWVGVDANAIAQSSGLGGYAGLRVDVPHFDLRVGARYFAAFTHTYLETKLSYDRIDLETSGGTAAKTLTYEAEADVSIPAGPGAVLLRGSFSIVTGVPDGQSVFEETLHVIVRPSLVWRARAAYVVQLGQHSQHSIGLAGDVLDVPNREDSLTVRLGPIIRLVLSRRVEVRGSFVTAVVSPDRIGLVGGDFTELGVRYRWASE